MQQKRTITLMAILLVLMAVYVLKPQFQSYCGQDYATLNEPIFKASTPPLLPGKNTTNILQVGKNNNGLYTAKIEYFFRGEPARAYALAQATSNENNTQYVGLASARLERGEHTIDIEIQRPQNFSAIVTKKVIVSLGTDFKPSASAELDYAIEWPDQITYFQRQQQPPPKLVDELHKRAVSAIDEGSKQSLSLAKANLERILADNPDYVPELLANGASLRSQYNRKLNALAYALMANDMLAASRLANFGANFDDMVGEEKYPVAMIAFLNQNVEAIALMQKSGINFSKLKFNGVSAIQYAKNLNNKAILDIVIKGSGYSL